MAGVVPLRILNRHRLTVRQMVEMDLSARQMVEVLALSLSGICVLFLLGNYGAEGTFGSEGEEAFLMSLMVAGGLSLFVTAAWKGLIIRAEVQREEQGEASGGAQPSPQQVRSGEERSEPLSTSPLFLTPLSLVAGARRRRR